MYGIAVAGRGVSSTIFSPCCFHFSSCCSRVRRFKEMDNQKMNPTRKRRIAGWFLHKAGEAPVLRCREERWDHHFQLCSQLSCIVPVLSFNFHCFFPLPGPFLSFFACHQNTERQFPQGKRQVASNDFRKQIRIFRACAVIGIFFTCYWEEDTSAAVDINSTYQTVKRKQRFG